MTTLVAGRILSTWRVASKPLSKGMAMSINTTSGRSFFGQDHCLTAVLRLAEHFEAVFEFEHFAKSFAYDHVVFRQQNSYRFHKSVYLVSRRTWRQGNAHLDFRAGASNGYDLEVAVHIGRSLAHAEQTKAALSFSSCRMMIRVEADPVVIDHQLHNVSRLRQMHRHATGAGVFLHIF